MGELRVRLTTSHGAEDDVVILFGKTTTIGQLADELELSFDTASQVRRTLQRTNRGQVAFHRETPLPQVDLRNGDLVTMVVDSTLGAAAGAATPVALLRVVKGADLDSLYALHIGDWTIGRSALCDIRLKDALASRRHAIVRVSDIIEVVDAGSTNGAMVNGSELSGTRSLRPGDRLLIGDTELLVELPGSSHEMADIIHNSVAFNRPPRIQPQRKPVVVSLPAPPDPPARRWLPLTAAVASVVVGGGLYAVSRDPSILVFAPLTPLLLAGNLGASRMPNDGKSTNARADWESILRQRTVELDSAYEREAANRHHLSPSTDELRLVVSGLKPQLWERRPTDRDFLSLRVGKISLPSDIKIETPVPLSARGTVEVEAIRSRYASLPPVPVTLDMRESPVALVGPPAMTGGIARSLLVQAAALHAPSELVIGALVSGESAAEWDWLKWLPHSRRLPGHQRSPNAVGRHEAVELLALLEELMALRMPPTDEMATASSRQLERHPHLLLVITDDSINVSRSRFSELLAKGSGADISLLWMASDVARIPSECRSIIAAEPGAQAVSLSSASAQFSGIPFEQLDVREAEGVARVLAPILDISAPDASEAELPSRVNLVDLLGGPEILENPTATIERWQESAPTGRRRPRLAAPVGVATGGILSIDLLEDGPHGLIGGTTGAGKSEFLLSLLAAMAASHSPERLNFLLIDYKGGYAYRDLANLHHTVGMITDLTPALAERALLSLRAELARREHILMQHGVKDLLEMARLQPSEAPPSLLIVVDELAALVQELPSFVDGLVDIASRGRSLGLHMLLATQRPSGVITPSIQANTNLRIALRMAADDDSNEIVNSPLASRLDRSKPGRGLVRRGFSDPVIFQSAYVSGTTTPESVGDLAIGELSLSETRWITSPWRPEHDPSWGTGDLPQLVRMINSAAAALGCQPSRRPWLDPLPKHVDLLTLERPKDNRVFPFGLADQPQRQAQPLALFRPEIDGSILLYGVGGSGKTVALRSLAASLGLGGDGALVHVYALDFAGHGLALLDSLPHVGSVIAADDYERVTRLFSVLRDETEVRARLFADTYSSSLSEYNQVEGVRVLPRLVVLLDGYDNFTAAYEGIDRGVWLDVLTRLVADGRSVGVHFVMTGYRRHSFPISLSGLISTRLVFRMASKDDYLSLNADPVWFDQSTPPGRCRLGDTEVQVAMLGSSGDTAEEALAFLELGRELALARPPAPPIRTLPSAVLLDDLPDPQIGLAWLLTEEFAAIGPDLSRNVLIAGRPASGKTSALASLAEAATRSGVDFEVYAADPAGFPGGAQSIDALVERVSKSASGLIFVDDADWISLNAGGHIVQSAISAGSLRIVATTDSSHARGYDPMLRLLRERADILLLQPDSDLDSEIMRRPLPRTARLFPCGRGYVQMLDGFEIVQVALAAQPRRGEQPQ